MIDTNFDPKFSIASLKDAPFRNSMVSSLWINAPHEDFPDYVDSTEKTLRLALEYVETGGVVDELFIRQVHSSIFSGREDIIVGAYRKCDVTVGDFEPPTYLEVPSLMSQLMVLEPYSMDRRTVLDVLRAWYIHFNSIHPFQDGNGRTSGVIVSAIHKKVWGEFLCPHQ